MCNITVGVAAAALTAGMVTTAAGATVTGSATTAAGIEAPLPANAASDPSVSVNSVSCASAGTCAAVGSYTDSAGNLQGLLLTRTAGTWAGVEAPVPAGAASDPIVLANSVSCASAGTCAAVGRYTDSSGNQQGLLLTWTAGSWKAAKALLPADAASTLPILNLASVSCVSAGNCVAVGYYPDSSDTQQGLLLTQTAGTWRAAKAPLPAGAAARPTVTLSSVSCASAGTCTAVGSYADSSGNQQGLLLTRTAGTWRAAKAPLPAGAAAHSFVTLSSVSCASAGSTCSAVGSYADSAGNLQGLLLTRTAGTWRAAEAPLPAGAAAHPFVMLSSVSCASASNCTAVGGYPDSSGNQQGLLLTWAAGTWKAAKAPLPAGAASDPGVAVNSVSCASAGTCAAVGGYTDSSGNQQGLLLTHTAGTWRAAKAPLPANAAAASQFAALSSVSCASAHNCIAVGNYTDGSGNRQGLLVTQTSA